MKAIKVSELKAGTRFDQPVYIEGENILVPAEIPLKQKDIDQLLRWEIEEVYTEGSALKEDQEIESRKVKEARPWLGIREEKHLRTYSFAVEKVDKVFQELSSGGVSGHGAIDQVVSDLLDAVRQGRNELIQLILLGDVVEQKLASSAVNCTIISAVIAYALKLTSHRLLQVATGALLHDLGMLKISKDILGKEGKLSPEEVNQIRTHPILSYQIISKELKYPEEIAAIALQHHEHWDGKGYPRRLKGEDILIGARIVSVADAYEAMVNERPYRRSMIGYSAMKSLLSDNGKHFDPKALKAFLESVGVFPIGSIVQLNDASIGRVAENHVEAPLRPKLELLVDEYGARIKDQEIVDLVARKNLFIAKAIDPKVMRETIP